MDMEVSFYIHATLAELAIKEIPWKHSLHFSRLMDSQNYAIK